MAFSIYKRGQGKYTRLGSAFGISLISAIGCYRLYEQLSVAEWELSRNTVVLIATLVPAGVLVVLAGLIFWLVNRPSIADFMIAAEGEMKKVSWSSRKEIAVSTFVVIVVVIVMAMFLGAVDILFEIFFDAILK